MLENISKLTNNTKLIPSIVTCLVATFLIAVAAQISIPLPWGVPMTLQTFSIAFIGYSLSESKSVKTVLIYLFLGAIGIPVFAGAKFGIPAILGLTGGFLFGFIPLAFFCSKSKKTKSLVMKMIFSIIGLALCHIFGVLQYSFLTNTNFIQAAALVSVPFLLKDALSVILASMVSEKINLKK